MYKATDRERLLNRIISFMRDSSAFEGLLQVGSGDVKCVNAANQQLQQFFTELGTATLRNEPG